MNPRFRMIATAGQFVDFFGLPSAVAAVGLLKARPDKVSMTILDGSFAMFVHVEAQPTAFALYETTTEQQFGLDLAKVDDFMKRAAKVNKDQATQIVIGDDNLVYMTCGRLRAKFPLEGYAPDAKKPNVEALGLTTHIKVQASELQKFTEILAGLSEEKAPPVTFRIHDGQLQLETTDGPNSAAVDVEKATIEGDRGDMTVSFGSQLVKAVCDALAGRDVTVDLRADHPMHMIGTRNNITAEAFVAPLIMDAA